MRFFTKEKLVITTLVVALVAAALLALLYLSLGKIFKMNFDENAFKEEFKKSHGLELNLEDFNVETTPSLHAILSISKLSVQEPKTHNELLSLSDAKIGVKLIPLIFKRVSFTNISASDLSADISRDQKGIFNLQKYMKDGGEYKLDIKKAKLDIAKYSLNLDDLMLNNKINLEGSSLLADRLDFKKHISLSTVGNLSIEQNITGKTYVSPYKIVLNSRLPIAKNISRGDVKLDIQVDNLELNPYSKYIRQFAYKGLQDAKGKVNFKLYSSKSKVPIFLEARTEDVFVSFAAEDKFSTIKAPGKSSINANFDIEGDSVLKIKNLSFIAPDANIHLKGKIQNYKKKKPALDIETTIKNSSAQNIIELIPDLVKTPEDSIRKLKKYKAVGKVNGALKLKGALPRPKMFGRIDFKDVHFNDESVESQGTHLAEGFCEFDSSNLAINIRVNMPQETYVDIIGNTELLAKPKANFKIISSKNMDAQIAHNVAVKMKDIIGFQLGPLPLMKVAGKGEISLETDGTKEKATVNGYFILHDMTASFNGINTSATNANGKIVFKDHDVVYNGLTAKVEGAPAKINGSASNNGKVDITFDIVGMKLSDGLKVSITSPLTKDILKNLKLVKSIEGNGNVHLNLNGTVKNISKISKDPGNLAGTLEPTLKLEFLGANVVSEPNIQVKNLKGTIDYDKNFKLKLSGRMYDSNFDLDGTIIPLKESQKIDLNFHSKEFKFNDFLYFLENGVQQSPKPEQLPLIDFAKRLNMLFLTKINLKGDVFFDGKNIDLSKVQLDGTASGLNPQVSALKFHSGNIKFQGQKILLEDLNTSLWGANVILRGNVDKIFDKNQVTNLKINLRRFPLSKLNSEEELNNLPEAARKILSDYEDFKGVLGGNIDVSNNKYGGELFFSNVSAFNKVKKMALELKSGEIKMSDNKLNLNALNLSYGQMPVYLDAVISNMNNVNPAIDASFSTNLSEASADAIINQNLAYPIKVKGELVIKGKIKGTVDDYNILANVVLNPQTDISYMGASLGDVDSKREFGLNANFKKDSVRVYNGSYIKYLASQNNKLNPHPIMKTSGMIYLKNNHPYFSDFSIRTSNPAPAGLFNIVFKKSILKQGNFSCNLNLNGNALAPLILGDISFDGLNIPLYNSEIKQANFNLKGDIVQGTLTGQGLKSDIKITTELKNSSKLPLVFKKLDIESKKVSLDKILEEMAFISSTQKNPGVMSSSSQIIFNPADIVVENGTYRVEEVNFHKIKAKNFDAKFSQDSAAVFKVDNLTFDIAGGQIISKGTYEFDKARLNLTSQIKDCEANTLSYAFLGISDQLFGKLNGEMFLTGSQLHTAKGLETVSAKAQFEVKKGKMPKLGSLEYLLRAGNFIKSGIFGLTLNNIIEVIIPYKTGEFDSIKGNLLVEGGKVEKLELYSKGENLSLFAHGTYDLATGFADINILGRLSKKVSNLLGPIGNASLNSLFNILSAKKLHDAAQNEIIQNINKIPLIELSGEDVRIFAVKILGDLNKEGYVKSFDWLD